MLIKLTLNADKKNPKLFIFQKQLFTADASIKYWE